MTNWKVEIGLRNGHTRCHWFWRLLRRPIKHIQTVVDWDHETGVITYDKPIKTAPSTNEHYYVQEIKGDEW